ncbi:MAG: hypothetical protein PHF37_05500 [Phycisphaerae bacterium]|nr:hypothetical protein [Phycisphaerae bacterium]
MNDWIPAPFDKLRTSCAGMTGSQSHVFTAIGIRFLDSATLRSK